MSTSTEELIILTHAEFVRLKQDVKEAGIDLCYTAETGEPIRLDWSLQLMQDPLFVEQLQRRRPVDASFRIVSVQHTKQGGWFRPDQFKLTFHAVGAMQEEALQTYLSEHNIQSSAQAPKAMLGLT
ncbi:MAG: hypothetical protein ETSY2_32150 [Candidatus Entotheonella gemina]|uniref:Uncharacterized protein n=1 Tax=Candidatus Entotheonella gemina TaxID=1429439 RepID=W4M0M1_9BACT|nr:MAG: hypothetical protein ETSY2_32150 [Candidatus Entotheonella gemina]